jgi:hypothetical protein
MRYRYVAFGLALAAVAVFAGRRLFYPAVSLHAATLSSTPSQSYLVILGRFHYRNRRNHTKLGWLAICRH